MKRERRQELKTNDLSVQLQRFSEYLQNRASTLIAVGVGVVLVVIALLYRNHSMNRTSEQGWAAFYESRADRTASDWVSKAVQRYRDIYQAYDDPHLALLARMQQIDLCLEEAPQAATEQLKRELLDTAEGGARAILQMAGNNVALQAAALSWLAAVEENRFTVDRDLAHEGRAREFLERIRNGPEFTGTAFQADVLERLNDYDSLWEPVVLADPPPPAPAEPAQPEEGPEATSPAGNPIHEPQPGPPEGAE